MYYSIHSYCFLFLRRNWITNAYTNLISITYVTCVGGSSLKDTSGHHELSNSEKKLKMKIDHGGGPKTSSSNLSRRVSVECGLY